MGFGFESRDLASHSKPALPEEGDLPDGVRETLEALRAIARLKAANAAANGMRPGEAVSRTKHEMEDK